MLNRGFIKVVGSALIWLTITFQVASAQTAVVKELARQMTDSLAYLKLNSKQKPKVIALNEKAAASLVAIAKRASQDTSMQNTTVIKKTVETIKARNSGLEQLLTSAQKKRFQDHKVYKLSEMQTRIMTAQLGLSADQIPQVYYINLQHSAEMLSDVQELKAATTKTQKARVGKSLKADVKEKDQELKRILSEDQFEKYEQNKEYMHEVVRESAMSKK